MTSFAQNITCVAGAAVYMHAVSRRGSLYDGGGCAGSDAACAEALSPWSARVLHQYGPWLTCCAAPDPAPTWLRANSSGMLPRQWPQGAEITSSLLSASPDTCPRVPTLAYAPGHATTSHAQRLERATPQRARSPLRARFRRLPSVGRHRRCAPSSL
ncbi:hypothetical protein PHLGIDRAFT_416363 [Phlebiopsis gigantea 11061_1 CR5-6]|uniref:Uncharacterized protein n=1 Tax=Phlebiopsis gigantea (strain 11061_1 CR5-6) TaxID=745531 RepID=A0A0C3SDG8_PHLG1|nr:hypothetical protein PHLGIDRAFT_416363 [Phlebiopsis gigantea 11061_1 CR5-6]